MRTAARLAIFGGGLVVIFAVATLAARAFVPTSVADSWARATGPSDQHSADQHSADQHSADQHSGDRLSGDRPMGHGAGQTDHAMGHNARPGQGVSLDGSGYQLAAVTAPDRLGPKGTLSFRIFDKQGNPVTDYTPEHTKDLHLIVVRSDGSQFRHVHPRLDDTGTWSLPWRWATAGSYRLYADFTPAGADAVTLASQVEIGGHYAPATTTQVARTSSVDGFEVSISGDLRAGADSALRATVSRNGRAVTDLQPYLGAFGHLVVLRQGDLAYLHVHPTGSEPAPGAFSGPDIGFMADVPTPGRYFGYLDFRIDGRVHTASFVLNAR